MFALANIANEDRFEDQSQGESCIVADDLPVVWRITIDEFDREAELVCIEIPGTLDVGNEELCPELRMGRDVGLGSSVMASAPDLSTCPRGPGACRTANGVCTSPR